MIKLVHFLHRKFPEIFGENEYETLLKEVEEERNENIGLAIERALLLLPETVGHLIANHIAMSKMNSAFYTDHPEFRDKKDIVASVIEMVEGQNPHLTGDYQAILAKAVPVIKDRIKITEGLNTTTVSEPSREFHGVV